MGKEVLCALCNNAGGTLYRVDMVDAEGKPKAFYIHRDCRSPRPSFNRRDRRHLAKISRGNV